MSLSRPLPGMYDPRYEHDACGVGAVVNVNGKKEHAIIERAKQVLVNLLHRGAAGADEATGDGAGILLQIPHDFFAAETGLGIGEAGKYGVAMVLLPRDAAVAGKCQEALATAVTHYGMRPAGWRDVPVDNSCLADLAKSSEPVIRQMFIGAGDFEGEALERQALPGPQASGEAGGGGGGGGGERLLCLLDIESDDRL